MHGQLMETLKTRFEGCGRIALLGIGSELRGDDAAGVLVVRELRKLVSSAPVCTIGVAGFEGGNAPENVTGGIKTYQPSHILIVDAAEIGENVGFCREIALGEISDTLFSTHTLPLKVLVDYLEQTTGAGTTVLGIQPGCLDFGREPTREIRNGVLRLSRCLYDLISGVGRRLSPG